VSLSRYGHEPGGWERIGGCPRPTTMTRIPRVAAALAALAVVTVAGCSAGGKSASSSAGAPANDKAAAAPQQAGGAAQGLGSAPNADPNQVPVDQPAQRSVIYTGAISLRVDDVAGMATIIEALAVGAGGYVGGDQRQLAGGKSTATLTLRVPAEKFTATMDAIRTKGHEEHEDVSSQDVTGTVIDLAARIQAQQASVNRVWDLLAKAQSIADITTIESELAKREADLEAMQAKQANLTDLASLSTITVELLGPDTTAVAPKPADKGFVAGLKHGWHAFTASVGVLLTVLGAVLPFLVLLALIAAGAYWWLRRRRRARPVT
jgi:hypothetical protein